MGGTPQAMSVPPSRHRCDPLGARRRSRGARRRRAAAGASAGGRSSDLRLTVYLVAQRDPASAGFPIFSTPHITGRELTPIRSGALVTSGGCQLKGIALSIDDLLVKAMVALLMLGATPDVVAQSPAPCESMRNTLEINACSSFRANNSEADMIAELERLLAVLVRVDQRPSVDPKPSLVSAVRKAQEAWLAYRAAQCEVSLAAVRGSAAGAEYGACLDAMNRARAAWLGATRSNWEQELR
jgi:uncharacterized protein YecT (DUF1311 family)